MTENTVNEPRNKARSVTVGLPTPRYELIDSYGEVIGSFISPAAAANRANYLWPSQEQDPERTGSGWDVQIAGVK